MGFTEEAKQRSAMIEEWVGTQAKACSLSPGQFLCDGREEPWQIETVRKQKTECQREAWEVRGKTHRAEFLREIEPGVFGDPTGRTYYAGDASGNPTGSGWRPYEDPLPVYHKRCQIEEELRPEWESTGFLIAEGQMVRKDATTKDASETPWGKRRAIQERIRAAIRKEAGAEIEESLLAAENKNREAHKRLVRRWNKEDQAAVASGDWAKAAEIRGRLAELEIPGGNRWEVENPNEIRFREGELEITLQEDGQMAVEGFPHLIDGKLWKQKKEAVLAWKETPQKRAKKKVPQSGNRETKENTGEREYPEPAPEGCYIHQFEDGSWGCLRRNGWEECHGTISNTGYRCLTGKTSENARETLEKEHAEAGRERTKRAPAIKQIGTIEKEALEVAGAEIRKTLSVLDDQEFYTVYHAAHAALAEKKVWLATEAWRREPNKNGARQARKLLRLPHAPASRAKPLLWRLERRLRRFPQEDTPMTECQEPQPIKPVQMEMFA